MRFDGRFKGGGKSLEDMQYFLARAMPERTYLIMLINTISFIG
jgi:hypothetical protein